MKRWFYTRLELLSVWEKYERYLDLKAKVGGKPWTFFEWLNFTDSTR